MPATYIILKGIQKILVSLKPAQRWTLSKWLAKLLYYFFPIRESTVHKDLHIAFPFLDHDTISRVSSRLYLHSSWNLVQFFALPTSYEEADFSVRGKSLIQRALTEQTGAIIVSGHFGAWEMLAAWLGREFESVAGIVQKQRNRGAHKCFKELRESVGIIHIDRKMNPNQMTDVLKKNHILVMLSDQDARKHGVFVNFFGRKSSTPRGASIFHYRSKSPIFFATCSVKSPFEYSIEIHEVHLPDKRDPVALTQSFTGQLENAIKKNPDQYFWFHKRWKTTIHK